MRIIDLLDRRSICLDGNPKDKKEAIDMLVDLMANSGNLIDKKVYKEQVLRREEEGTTGIGEGIAIPHGKGGFVRRPGISAMVVKNGVDYDSLDGQPVKLIFMIAAPDNRDNVHLDVLSKLSVLMLDEEFSKNLIKAESVDEFLRIIDKADRRDEVLGSKVTNAQILAVTSCPTGIAHTYMAAEGLEKAAKKAGCTIKIETRGSSGVKNQLTSREIENAECIIVATDSKVPMDRFSGKKVIQCKVSDGISKADKLIAMALKGDAKVYEVQEEVKHSETSEDKNHTTGSGGSLGHNVYTWLMNGVSHMLPFVVGGGILIALAFLIDSLSVDMSALPEDMKANFGSITEAAALLKKIGDAAFGFMLPVLAGYIAMAIGDRPALAVGFVGGYIASTGKSGFLGALLAGFLAGFIIIVLKKICSILPEVFEKIAPVLIYPLVGIFLIGVIMYFVVEPPVGALNEILNNFLNSMNSTSKVLLGVIVAGMMAIDMGGPFNKAAYVFGTAAIAEGNYDIMAAVMIGGMVPPCAIALATLIFRNKFSKQERQSGPTNFIMGLSFITEGAIPYASADPARVIPSCIIGSALAGALSMAFGCTLMAPHGGIFVFPVVGHPWYYLLALVAGTFAAAVIMGLLKKKVQSE